MKTSQKPIFSIVVCSFNGQATVERAVQSLLQQDYPKGDYEIIVVDDGSLDDTAQIISKLPVRFIKLPANRGLSAARNVGLAQARGRIFVGFDDDCVAEENWLSELSRGYELANVAGVGGHIIMRAAKPNIVARYMHATDCGNPPTLEQDSSMSITKRFSAYYRAHFTRSDSAGYMPRRVRELNGANASFPIELLRSVNGWDEKLSGVEDTDLCKRIAVRYPDFNFYAVNTANLQHDPSLSLTRYFARFYRRGAVNLKYYRSNNLIPPIFPFPILILALSLLVLILAGPYGLLALALLPLLCYIWWPIRAMREAKLDYLAFSYIQFIEESSVLVGLLRGFALSKIKP